MKMSALIKRLFFVFPSDNCFSKFGGPSNQVAVIYLEIWLEIFRLPLSNPNHFFVWSFVEVCIVFELFFRKYFCRRPKTLFWSLSFCPTFLELVCVFRMLPSWTRNHFFVWSVVEVCIVFELFFRKHFCRRPETLFCSLSFCPTFLELVYIFRMFSVRLKVCLQNIWLFDRH